MISLAAGTPPQDLKTMINIRSLFNRRTALEERRQLTIEVLRGQVRESVDRRRNGTTDPIALMAQLQDGDQGDQRRLESLQAAYAYNTAAADKCLARWAGEIE